MAIVSVVCGLALLVSATVAACQGDPDSIGAEDVAALASPGPTAEPAAAPSVPVTSGTIRSAEERRPPVTLRIPGIDLTAYVDEVGVDPESGDFDVPPSVDRIGWYKFGPGLEADAGSVVIAGHVDSADQGRGAFYRLPELEPGDLIEAVDADGTTYEFEVVAREVWDKQEVPLEQYFARDGEVRLTLFTCGGPFDRAESSYRDNVVVTAVPA